MYIIRCAGKNNLPTPSGKVEDQKAIVGRRSEEQQGAPLLRGYGKKMAQTVVFVARAMRGLKRKGPRWTRAVRTALATP